MIKRIIGSFILTGFLLSAGQILAQDKMIDQIVAVVGKNIILKSDIEYMVLDQQTKGVTSDGDMKCEVLESLLVQKLLLAEAELDTTINVTDSQINGQLDRQMQMYISRLGSEKEVEAYMKKPIIDIKAGWYDIVKDNIMTQDMQGKIVDKVTASPAEVRLYFRNLSGDKIPQIDDQIEYAQITIQPTITQIEDEKVKEQLRDLKRRIENGESFAGLAAFYSEDPSSVKTGGELDYKGRGELDPAYAAAAFNLKGDKISNVVKSELGYHIIQVIDRKGESIKTRHILMKPKISEESMKKAFGQIDSIADYIRKGTVKFDAAALRWSYDKNSRNNGGVVVNSETGDAKWKLSELDPDVSKVVTKMNINEISKPFKTLDDNERPIYKIIKLIGKISAHKANVRDDYVALSEEYLKIKKEQAFDKWIRDKQAGTYIHIDNSYLNCNFKYHGWVK